LLNISERLRELRVKFGYTQNQIAKLLNIDRSTYAYYETGKTHPDVASLLILSRMYNISLDQLLDDETAPKSVSDRHFVKGYVRGNKNSSHIYDLSPQEKDLIGAYRSCSDEEREEIMRLAFSLIKKHGGPTRTR
jgi:transcriptional regulator with XRE-family HTH domain